MTKKLNPEDRIVIYKSVGNATSIDVTRAAFAAAETKSAATRAASDAFAAAVSAFDACIASGSSNSNADAASALTDAASALTDAASAVDSADVTVVRSSGSFLGKLFPGAGAFIPGPRTSSIQQMFQTDSHLLMANADPLLDPLWPGGENPLADKWQASLPVLRNTPGGEFWIDWYQRALDGRPQNWPMLRDIALIENDIWRQGGEALNQRITEIQREYAADTITDGERIKPNPPDEVLPPPLDPALPLRINDENRISLAPQSMTREEIEGDLIRPQLHEILKDQVTELVRISGNRDDSVYRTGMKLSALLEAQFDEMDPLKVHLQIEVLRRRREAATADDDRDVLLAIDAVIQTGPGLTLDTRPVDLFLDRARRNQLLQKEEAELEAEIRLAKSIGESEVSAPDTQEIARLAADSSEIDQFTAIRPTLDRNFVILAAGSVLSGIAGNLMYADLVVPATAWLVANYDTILILAKYWGEPFAAWITPILAHVREIDDGLAANFRRL